MQKSCSREYYLRTSDFDYCKRLHASSILDLFQDVAGIHAEILGCGHSAFLKNSRIWVLVRVKFKVLSTPEMFQKVTVKTWPLPPSRAGFQREYLIEDENGKVLVKGSSDWVIIDSETRRLLPTKDVYPFEDGFIETKVFEDKNTKIFDFTAEKEGEVFLPTFSDIDMNNHVNNTKYANFVLNTVGLTKGQSIKEMQIDYRHEVKSGEAIKIAYRIEENEISAKGIDQNGETKFFCKIIL